MYTADEYTSTKRFVYTIGPAKTRSEKVTFTAADQPKIFGGTFTDRFSHFTRINNLICTCSVSQYIEYVRRQRLEP